MEKKELTTWDYFTRGIQILTFTTGLFWGIYSKILSPTFVFVQEYRSQSARFESQIFYIRKDLDELRKRVDEQQIQKNKK